MKSSATWNRSGVALSVWRRWGCEIERNETRSEFWEGRDSADRITARRVRRR
jgi:hypothetical protein